MYQILSPKVGRQPWFVPAPAPPFPPLSSQKELTRTVVIHPRFLGKKLRKTVTDTLKAEVVGSCIDGAHVIAVLRIADDNVSRGTIEPLTGSVRYDVTYRAIMFRPFKNEILDCVATQVTAVRAWCVPVCVMAP